MDAANVIATVIATIALAVSIWSAWYAKQAVDESRAIRRLEQERRRVERTPVLQARIEDVNEGSWFRLWVRVASDESLDALAARITQPEDLHFAAEQTGVVPGDGPSKMASWGRVPIAEECVAWRIVFAKGEQRNARVLLTPTVGDDTWDIEREVKLPDTYDVLDSIG